MAVAAVQLGDSSAPCHTSIDLIARADPAQVERGAGLVEVVVVWPTAVAESVLPGLALMPIDPVVFSLSP